MTKLKLDIAKTKRETQQVDYKVKLESIEDVYGDQKCVFVVLQSSTKGKIKDILKAEEKLRIESDRETYTGTLVDIVGNELHILLYHPIPLVEYKISRLINYNNDILINELSNVKISENFKNFVVSAFTKCIFRKIQALKKIKDEFVILAILIQKDEEFDFDKTRIEVLKDKLKSIDLETISLYIDNLMELSEKQDIQDILFENNINTNIVYCDKNLNNSQKQAVNEINNSTSYKIIGPPGTGKTSTIVEIISQLLKRRKKILVCGPSNISIDNIIEKFESSIFYSKTPTKFYRRGSSFKGLKAYNLEKIVDEITKFVEKEDTDKNFKRTLKKIKDKYKNEIQLETDLVFATVFSSRKELNHFDWVIVDEACQSSAVECFLALTHGQNIILVGDPNQLCHEFRSLYELLDMKTYLLDVQYRMCERLIGFSNETFYNNKIKSFIKDSHFVIQDTPCVFVDTSNVDYQESEENTSKINVGEAELVEKIISYIKSDDIGVISPYSAQVLLLKERLPYIEVATVDGFQGREKEFIIISLVRSNIDGDFGFLDNFKRLNVAVTRCKKGLIVVGNSDNFRKCNVVSKFFKYIDRKFITIDPIEIEEYFE